ncbi:hypothetical protein ACFQZS_15385 [Mucilaginibacter calamicampi]|uniref:Uncharacterized protein n=1 Tax=Mucilaginibacter calamicampi TaxID=1302352 RepID=A0ABW2YZ79_9SPHI
MQGISFSRINIKTYNAILCVVLPLVLLILLAEYIPALMNKFNVKWIFSLDFLRFILVISCYTLPLTYFLSKGYELADFNKATWGSTVLGFIICCVALLPLSFILLVLFAKISFFIPMAFTAAIIFIYFRSLKRVTV